MITNYPEITNQIVSLINHCRYEHSEEYDKITKELVSLNNKEYESGLIEEEYERRNCVRRKFSDERAVLEVLTNICDAIDTILSDADSE